MLEHAREDEKTPFEMAYRVNAIIIASVHTNGMTLTSILFNLCALPKYFSILREEIDEVTKKLGPMGAAGPGSRDTTEAVAGQPREDGHLHFRDSQSQTPNSG